MFLVTYKVSIELKLYYVLIKNVSNQLITLVETKSVIGQSLPIYTVGDISILKCTTVNFNVGTVLKANEKYVV